MELHEKCIFWHTLHQIIGVLKAMLSAKQWGCWTSDDGGSGWVGLVMSNWALFVSSRYWKNCSQISNHCLWWWWWWVDGLGSRLWAIGQCPLLSPFFSILENLFSKVSLSSQLDFFASRQPLPLMMVMVGGGWVGLVMSNWAKPPSVSFLTSSHLSPFDINRCSFPPNYIFSSDNFTNRCRPWWGLRWCRTRYARSN